MPKLEVTLEFVKLAKKTNFNGGKGLLYGPPQIGETINAEIQDINQLKQGTIRRDRAIDIQDLLRTQHYGNCGVELIAEILE